MSVAVGVLISVGVSVTVGVFVGVRVWVAVLEDLEDAGAADGDDDDAAPEMTISPKLHERHDYLVLYFYNELDWRAALTAFNVQTVRSGPVGAKTTKQRGLGRVIAGRDALRLLGVEAGGD